MIDVLGFALAFLLAWNGRDTKVWTPTFEGTPEERFVSAMLHYKDKMGIEDSLIFTVSPHPKNCASVQKSRQWDAVIVSWHVDPKHPERQSSACRRVKPEQWALHEAAHLRMQHHHMAISNEQKEREAKELMLVYSAKERR